MMEFPTEKEREWIKLYAMLPMILHIFDRDRKVLEESALKTKGPYFKLLEWSWLQAERDLTQIKKGFRAANIKIYKEDRTKEAVALKYLCRGYHHEARFEWQFLKYDIEVLMERYLGLREKENL